MGGLTAALRLARHGFGVRVLEARGEPGGLAGGFVQDGFPFDAGPYILLDRPGLAWAFEQVGLRLEECLSLQRLEHVYEVSSPESVVRFHADRAATADGLEKQWPGSGQRYVRFVEMLEKTYRRLTPLLRVTRPGPLDLLRGGGWLHIPFLLRPLASILAASGLPKPVCDALAIWTHVAGQRVAEAPSPLAFVSSLIHTVGAFYPMGGLGAVPRALADAAVRAGVQLCYGVKVRAIRCEGGRITGVETERGEFLAADAVVCNAAGVGAYLELVRETPQWEREKLARLPLQSPGVCAYLALRGARAEHYLRFMLPGGDELCRLLIRPAAASPGVMREGWEPARLLAPMAHAEAEHGGPGGQRAYLERILQEDWWRSGVTEHRVLATRIPAEWGTQYHLYRRSMNPVMTARFMRAGRLAHRSPFARGLYLAGSATHPGQWVSFCAISGVLAADCLREDFR
jgi:phytoene dehydrogenase-like protein